MIIRPQEKRLSFGKLRRGEVKRQGLSTGFISLNPLIRLARGYMMIVSGYPSSGKSEFLDAILLNLALTDNWKTLYYSPENHPVEEHMVKLAEKFIGKPLQEFNEDDSNRALDFLDRHYVWTYPEHPTIEKLLSLGQTMKDTEGLDCFVIDPWNAIEHKRGKEMVHEYLGEALTKIIRFGRDNNVLMGIVAHPTKPQKDKDGNIPVPNLYDISDGAMWRNKADYGLIVHRPDMSLNKVQVYVNKLKYKWMGKVGMAQFDYNYLNGRFKGEEEKGFFLPTDVVPPF